MCARSHWPKQTRLDRKAWRILPFRLLCIELDYIGKYKSNEMYYYVVGCGCVCVRFSANADAGLCKRMRFEMRIFEQFIRHRHFTRMLRTKETGNRRTKPNLNAAQVDNIRETNCQPKSTSHADTDTRTQWANKNTSKPIGQT